MKMYFKGGQGIVNPVDVDGTQIKVGDKLSADWGDCTKWTNEDLTLKMDKAYYVVKEKNGVLFGDGIDQSLYMHDFRFKYARIITNEQQSLTVVAAGGN